MLTWFPGMSNLEWQKYLWDLWCEQDQCCAYTGWDLWVGKRHNKDTTASLDRIDNDQGYEIGNVQWLHKDVNWMKGRFTEVRFKEICTAVASHAAL